MHRKSISKMLFSLSPGFEVNTIPSWFSKCKQNQKRRSPLGLLDGNTGEMECTVMLVQAHAKDYTPWDQESLNHKESNKAPVLFLTSDILNKIGHLSNERSRSQVQRKTTAGQILAFLLVRDWSNHCSLFTLASFPSHSHHHHQTSTPKPASSNAQCGNRLYTSIPVSLWPVSRRIWWGSRKIYNASEAFLLHSDTVVFVQLKRLTWHASVTLLVWTSLPWRRSHESTAYSIKFCIYI